MSVERQNLSIHSFERELEHIAAEWRGASAAQRPIVARKYAAMLEQLYAIGWDDTLPTQSLLPDEVMPARYFEHNPNEDGSVWRPYPGVKAYGPSHNVPDSPLFSVFKKEDKAVY